LFVKGGIMEIVDKEIIELNCMDIGSKNKFKLLLEKTEYDTGIIEMKINYNNEIFQNNEEDYFICYQKIKDNLLKCNIGIQCYGSMINVYPSPMMITSNNLAYILEMGKAALKKDIINIFDYADINKFATSEEQNNFYKEWIESIFGNK
jgi:hypothetical protein